jgi:integrase
VDHKTAKKTDKPRMIFLSKKMQRRLSQLKRRSRSRYVFVNTRGEPWTENAIRQQVARIRTKSHLASDVCAYLIRHTYGTWALMRGVGAATVAALMGHTSTEMVVKVYSHLADQHAYMKDAAERATQRPVRPKPPGASRRLTA